MHKQAGVRCLQVTGDAVGGIRLHVHTVIDALLRDGAPVFYTCSLHADLKGSQEIVDFEQKGVPVLRLAVKKRPAFADFVNILKVLFFARKNKINLIHGHGAKGGLYARLAGCLLGAKVIYTPHGGVVHAAFGWLTSRIYASVERLLRPLTSVYVFESDYTRMAFCRLIGCTQLSNSVVNYNGLSELNSIASNEPIAPSDKPSLLVVGMLRKEKGQDVMLLAAHVLKQRGVLFDLHFCGDGPNRSALKALSAKLGLDDCVQFHGDVQDVRPFFERTTLVVVPSNFESFGYVALEAAQYRRPLVASRVGGLCEIVIDHESGLLFEAGNPADLADKVQTVLRDPLLMSHMVDHAHLRSKQVFSVRQMLDGLMKVYQGPRL